MTDQSRTEDADDGAPRKTIEPLARITSLDSSFLMERGVCKNDELNVELKELNELLKEKRRRKVVTIQGWRN
jgi:hypothetical protein